LQRFYNLKISMTLRRFCCHAFRSSKRQYSLAVPARLGCIRIGFHSRTP
jgi:hypothetical protein